MLLTCVFIEKWIVLPNNTFILLYHQTFKGHCTKKNSIEFYLICHNILLIKNKSILCLISLKKYDKKIYIEWTEGRIITVTESLQNKIRRKLLKLFMEY